MLFPLSAWLKRGFSRDKVVRFGLYVRDRDGSLSGLSRCG